MGIGQCATFRIWTFLESKGSSPRILQILKTFLVSRFGWVNQIGKKDTSKNALFSLKPRYCFKWVHLRLKCFDLWVVLSYGGRGKVQPGSVGSYWIMFDYVEFSWPRFKRLGRLGCRNTCCRMLLHAPNFSSVVTRAKRSEKRREKE